MTESAVPLQLDVEQWTLGVGRFSLPLPFGVRRSAFGVKIAK